MNNLIDKLKPGTLLVHEPPFGLTKFFQVINGKVSVTNPLIKVYSKDVVMLLDNASFPGSAIIGYVMLSKQGEKFWASNNESYYFREIKNEQRA